MSDGRRARWFCLAVAVMLLHAREVHAAQTWLTLRGDGGCAWAADELARRVESAVAGVRNPALAVEVEIVAGALGSAEVRVLHGSELVGTKRIAASSCDAAREIVVAVAALALSSELGGDSDLEQPEHAIASSHTAPASRNRVKPGAIAVAQQRDDRATGATASAKVWRLMLGAGIDAGTLAQPTLLVSGGLARTLGLAELRVMARYGVPSTREEASTGSAGFARVRSDFGAAAVDACWGLDRARWLSACGGLELNVTRSKQRERAPGELGKERERVQPAFGPVAGLAFVLRQLAAQPHLELAAQLAVAGRAPALGFRAGVGGGVRF